MIKLQDITDWKQCINQVVQGDCLEGMKLIPDKSIDLVLTDPPYGINVNYFDRPSLQYQGSKAKNKEYGDSEWAKRIPTKEYFDELFRISKNQIIFGGNYFIEFLFNTNCFIVWDKNNTGNWADCEMAWTSFKTAAKLFKYTWNGMIQEDMKHKDVRFHPTQKPVELMRWILANYSKGSNDLICDPFMGSWTTARACKDLERNFIGFELEEKYCRIGEERLRQEVMF